MSRILLAGTSSGCGKTSLTCALLAAFSSRGLSVCAFKCGPDYIDPMFHRAISGVSCHNLDPFFCNEEQLRQLFLQNNAQHLNIIEGVMGYYDGVGFTERCSSYTVARALNAPAVLCVDAKGIGNSIEAILQGFVRHQANSGIRGVIFNRASSSTYERLREIAMRNNLLPLGYLPYDPSIVIKSRNLGLLTAGELPDLAHKMQRLGQLAEQYMDLEGLLALANAAAPLTAPPIDIRPIASGVKIAVAQDEAFCFLYPENIEVLRRLGCEIAFFSPLHDTTLPHGVSGLYLTGGYPELHLDALAGNTSMLQSVYNAVQGGLPTIAECGGFMYLHEQIGTHSMVGILKGRTYETSRPVRFGYLTATAKFDTLLCNEGERFAAHEFHYFESENNGASFTAQKAAGGASWECIHATETMHAGFPHLYFYSDIGLASSFVRKAALYESASNPN